jgi:phage terminase large subunit GpA-like protein
VRFPFNSLEEIVVAAAEAVRPPERLTVPQAAEKYRKLNNKGAYVGPWKNSMVPYLVEPMRVLTDPRYTGMIFVGPSQCGKALALDTPLPTPFGWATMGDVEAGDLLIGANGDPTEVLATSEVQYERNCFRVVFDDGTEIVADEDHLWSVRDRLAENWKTLTTGAMLSEGLKMPSGKSYRYRIPNAGPITGYRHCEEIPPYVLGVFLGDGSKSSGFIAVGDEDKDNMIFNLTQIGCGVSVYSDPTGERCDALRVVLPSGEKLGVYARRTRQDRKKHIPEAYLWGSKEDRMALLQGLMDTDGTSGTKRRVEFYQTDRVLTKQVLQLVRSLGFKPRVSVKPVPKGSGCSESYRIAFCARDGEKLFRIERKQSRIDFTSVGRPAQSGQRSIVAIEPVPSVPVKCVAVDAEDHLYLAGEGMVPTHNTEIYLNWHTYTVICDPTDMMLIEASQGRASDFSKRRIDRLHRDTPEVKERLISGRNYDNTFDKRYRSGAMVTLSWPTVNELSGKPIPRLFLTDYDRMDQNVEREGSPFLLAQARATSFRRYGMTVAESSPSFPVKDPRWSPSTPHEAPPTDGILSLYNEGDRRRFYWICYDCGHAFEPDFPLLKWDVVEDNLSKTAKTVRLDCPHCSAVYHESGGEAPGKHEMNQMGIWLRDGEKLTPDGEIVGEAIESEARTASFWLKGICAAFSDWNGLLLKYFNAQRTYERTGSEEGLQTVMNTGFSLPYLPKAMESERIPEKLKERAYDFGYKVVPPSVRFLVAAIDVQKNRFVVQVMGVGQGGDLWVVDRFDVRYSHRDDEERPGQVHIVKPFTYREDWRVLLSEVLLKTYPLGDNSGREMRIKAVVNDMGGMNQATANAYEFYRWLKNGPDESDPAQDRYQDLWVPGLHSRYQLYQGAPSKPSSPTPRTRISYPDSGRKDRTAGARGEIPVLQVNVTPIKNQIDAMLERDKLFSGKINFAHWLDINFYKELCVEVKDHTGVWQNSKGFRNESWDLLVMTQALLIERKHVGIERIDWSDPPSWASEWDSNDLVFDPAVDKEPFAKKSTTTYDLAKLAETLG